MKTGVTINVTPSLCFKKRRFIDKRLQISEDYDSFSSSSVLRRNSSFNSSTLLTVVLFPMQAEHVLKQFGQTHMLSTPCSRCTIYSPHF